jgi:hypothetical protein
MSWVNARKYYVVDFDYPSEYGFLGPYKGERYHLPEFHHRGQQRCREELFYRVHSLVRYVIEQTFGVWKTK